jgi:hypothetical protein
MPVKARAGGQGRVRTGRVGGQTGSGSSPGSPTGDPPAWIGPTWSPTDHREFVTISGANNQVATRNSAFGGNYASGRSDMAQTTGSRDVSITVTQMNGADMQLGVGNGAADLGQYAGSDNNSLGFRSGGDALLNGGFVGMTGTSTFGTGDVIGMRIDLDANTVAVNKNGGAWSSTASIVALRPASDPIFLMYSLKDTLNDAVTLNNV